MKRFAIIIAALCVLLPACQNSKPPVVQDTRVQITVTIPDDTPSGDAIYICGPLTGGDAFAVGNPQWKCARSGNKCTIALDQESFIGRKTLADGFWFISGQKGREVGADGKEVIRTLNANPGDSYEFIVAAWSK